MTPTPPATLSACDVDEALLREVIDLHCHPEHGARFWLRRQSQAGFDLRDRIRTLEDLALLGTIEPADLRDVSVWDFVPQTLHGGRRRLLVAETGGSSGTPVAAAYTPEDFHEAFIVPFIDVAQKVGFPAGATWLYVGPSGPHIIGRAARGLAEALDAGAPWEVDFDPRWAKKLAAGTLAGQRYLQHVVEQAIRVFRREEIEVLFTTPKVLERLAELLSEPEKARLRGIHYGGLAMTPAEVNRLRDRFPNAVHLAGYGNTLFGCALEARDAPRMHLDYFPRGRRLVFQVDRPDPASGRGRLVFHRLDRTTLLLCVRERDEVELIPPDDGLKQIGWQGCGIRDPRPAASESERLQAGLY